MPKIELFKYAEPYDENTRSNLRERVHSHLGHGGSFDDDIWIYKNHDNYIVSGESMFRIYFMSVPKQYKQITKYFILRNILAVSTMNAIIGHLNYFFNFIIDGFDINDLNDVNYRVLEEYRNELESMESVPAHIKKRWSKLEEFFTVMSDFKEVPKVSIPSPPNYVLLEKRNKKLQGVGDNIIPPKKTYLDLDRVFIKYQDGIPIHIQSAYWTLRLIPTRIDEVLSMSITKALRKVNNEFNITIPVPKTSSHIEIKEKIISMTGESEAEKHLIKVLKKQKEVALSLQKKVRQMNLTEGLLYTVQRVDSNTSEVLEKINYANILIGRYKLHDFNSWLRNIIIKADTIQDKCGNKIFHFRDDNGELYDITSHDFRHEAITDRLDYGFVTHKVMFLAGLNQADTLFGYYNVRKDKVVISKPIYNPNGDIKSFNEKLIKSSDIVLDDMENEIASSISFQGNAGVDAILLDFQVQVENQTPIVSNEGYYLGNCPNFYNCRTIKKQLNCIGCRYSNQEIVEGGMEFIDKALESYARDITFHEENGNMRMANLAKEFYKNFADRKRQILLGGNDEEQTKENGKT